MGVLDPSSEEQLLQAFQLRRRTHFGNFYHDRFHTSHIGPQQVNYKNKF
jgi:hypothetical protein